MPCANAVLLSHMHPGFPCKHDVKLGIARSRVVGMSIAICVEVWERIPESGSINPALSVDRTTSPVSIVRIHLTVSLGLFLGQLLVVGSDMWHLISPQGRNDASYDSCQLKVTHF